MTILISILVLQGHPQTIRLVARQEDDENDDGDGNDDNNFVEYYDDDDDDDDDDWRVRLAGKDGGGLF